MVLMLYENYRWPLGYKISDELISYICSENGPELVKNNWLVGQKLLVLSAILLLNFISFGKFDPILPKYDQIDQLN